MNKRTNVGVFIDEVNIETCRCRLVDAAGGKQRTAEMENS